MVVHCRAFESRHVFQVLHQFTFRAEICPVELRIVIELFNFRRLHRQIRRISCCWDIWSLHVFIHSALSAAAVFLPVSRWTGRVEAAISGGAPLGARLGHFYRGAGINILEGYGLTETTAGATLNLSTAQRVGSVGRPLPGTTIKIAEDGEVLIKGAIVMNGYWRNDAANSEVFTSDGFFKSGDLGTLDHAGFLSIVGRKKELIVTSGGKNVAPAVLEDRVRAHPLVSQCMVVGDNKPFIAALVTIDPDAIKNWITANKKDGATVATLSKDPDLISVVQTAIDEANKAVSRAESIRKFTILPTDFTIPGGQLTAKLSVKRHVVAAEFSQEIEALFT